VLRISLPLRIHTWGGLGSQLFAIELAQFLGNKFPNRKLTIFLHTGGVTRREPEIAALFPEFRYVFVDDFSFKSPPSRVQESHAGMQFRIILRSMARKSIEILGLTATCNEDKSVQRIRPWVLSLRGHYSYRTISPDFLTLLKQLVELKMDTSIRLPGNYCAIHYRLGDLLTLAEKQPIAEESIREEVSRVLSAYSFDSLIVLSDSPTEASIRLSGISQVEIVSPDFGTIDVIAASLHAAHFIGTSSKISFWIAAIRSSTSSLDSSLPLINNEQYKRMLLSKGGAVHQF
jgi:hypothetical protein